jgi:hypothetical protein
MMEDLNLEESKEQDLEPVEEEEESLDVAIGK